MDAARMLNIYLCVMQEHALPVLLLAAVISAVSAFAGIFMLDRARVRTGTSSMAWLTGGGFVFGGGVWVTHFVAMLGYDAGVPIAFGLPLTLLSAAIIVLAAIAGFALLHRARSGARIVSAGLVLGTGIATMHYTGMRGLVIPGVVSWEADYIAASILLSLGFSVFFAIAYSQLSRMRRRLAVSSTLAVIAVVTLHFTGVTALDVAPFGAAPAGHGLSAQMMAALIGAGALLLVAMGLIAAGVDTILSDRREAEATRLRAMVERLQESERRLQAANRAKSLFLSRMSHELRTPLNGIVGISSIMRRNAPADQQQMLDMVIACGKSLGMMVDDILDLARFEDGDGVLAETRFEAAALAAEAEAMHRPYAERKGLHFHAEHPGDIGWFSGDAARIAQIVSALLSNAIKFTDSGEVRLRTRLLGGGGLPDVARLEFVVEDTGVGVPEHAMGAIFEPFGQADAEITRKQEGAGLGLTLARKLCEMMGGSLTMQRLPGGGSRFRAVVAVTRALPETVAATAPAVRAA